MRIYMSTYVTEFYANSCSVKLNNVCMSVCMSVCMYLSVDNCENANSRGKR